MKPEYVYGTDCVLYQSAEMFRMNSDSELLGLFMRLKHRDSVLDIGTNNGVLLLYASCWKPKHLCGIDLFEEAIDLASKNMDANHVEAELHVSRLQDFRHERFDVLVCNPPYFSKSGTMVSENRYLEAARHDTNLPMEELFANAARLMKDTGRLYIVHRASRLMDLIMCASEYRLRPVRLQIAYESEGKGARSVLLEFSFARRKEMVIEPPVYLDRRETYPKGCETV